jgi:NADPH2 dehydrogenase
VKRGWVRLTSLKTAKQFRRRIDELAHEHPWLRLELDNAVEAGACSALGSPVERPGLRLANRFATLPMEGWDATGDGRPTERVLRRWRRFGLSGAGLVWGGEAYAVRADGRANPHQLCFSEHSVRDLAALRAAVLAGARGTPSAHTPYLGLQLTHSGRFSRPLGVPAPRAGYRHPLLDQRCQVTSNAAVLTDAELDELVGSYASAARAAQEAGFDFVDVKACHGYLLHELLSAHTRPGRYGGDLEGRARMLLDCIDAVKVAAPGLGVAVRLSAFDFFPFRRGPSGIGQPETWTDPPYVYAFGGDGSGLGIELDEPNQLLTRLEQRDVTLVCVSAGCPYTNPHLVRPAAYPPSDGYLPPEDPLVGVARQMWAVAELKRRHPALVLVGSGYTYLQEWLPAVAQRAVREARVDVVGLGRMVLSYPELPQHVLSGRPLERRRICRTFSDCTTAPRVGLASGCYRLDDYYRQSAERATLASVRQRRTLPD